MRHIFPNNITTQIYYYFLSLFRIYHVKKIEQQQEENLFISSPTTTISSSIPSSLPTQTLLDTIDKIQPINDMDTWSTYFWMKNLSTVLTYYILNYKYNHFKLNYLINISPSSSSTTISSSVNSSSSSSSNSSSQNYLEKDNNSISTLIETNPSFISSSSLSLSSTLNTKVTLTSPPMMTLIKQSLIIQKSTCDIVHQLDHLRPSEQFAKSGNTTQTIYQLIRYSTDTLRSHSILALLSIMGITQEILDHAPSELKRQIFYKSKLGRIINLEITSIFKTFTVSSSLDISLFYFNHHYHHQYQSYQNNHNELEFIDQLYSRFLKQPSSSSPSVLYDQDLDIQQQLQFLITALHPPIITNKKGWILDWLKLISANISAYDKNWTFGNEYENIISLAAYYL